MTLPAPAGGPLRKPSGPVMYTVTVGANVWPGIAESEAANVRVLDGDVAVLQESRRGGFVAVSVGGLERVLPRREWRALPVYRG